MQSQFKFIPIFIPFLQIGPQNQNRDPPSVRVIARNLAVFSNVTLTKTLYGIRKSGQFRTLGTTVDMLQILAAVKTCRSQCVVKI